MVSFASSIMKNIVVFPFESPGTLPVKLIRCVAFGSASSAYSLPKSVAIIL